MRLPTDNCAGFPARRATAGTTGGKSMYLKVKVTRKLIKAGTRHNSECCPIALAVRGAGAIFVGVGSVDIDWADAEGNHFYTALPRKARKFISDFDSGLDVCPIEFSIRRTKRW